jgi:hypothetical protein
MGKGEGGRGKGEGGRGKGKGGRGKGEGGRGKGEGAGYHTASGTRPGPITWTQHWHMQFGVNMKV